MAHLFEKHRVAPGLAAYSADEIERLAFNYGATLHARYREVVHALHQALAAEQNQNKALAEDLKALGRNTTCSGVRRVFARAPSGYATCCRRLNG